MPACTGTSSIWYGCSSLRCSICGEADHGPHRSRPSSRRRARPAASDRHLPEDLGPAVRAEHDVVPGGLLPRAGRDALGADRRAHDRQGRADRVGFHAHDVGAARAGVRDPDTAAVPAGADGADGGGGASHVRDAGAFFPLSRSAAAPQATAVASGAWVNFEVALPNFRPDALIRSRVKELNPHPYIRHMRRMAATDRQFTTKHRRQNDS
ncbi:protein of unknown function [Burkholderia multivorans]